MVKKNMNKLKDNYNGVICSNDIVICQVMSNVLIDLVFQVKKRNLFYSEVIKRGLPRRYDRLHDNLDCMSDVFGPVIFFEYFFNFIALLVSLQ